MKNIIIGTLFVCFFASIALADVYQENPDKILGMDNFADNAFFDGNWATSTGFEASGYSDYEFVYNKNAWQTQYNKTIVGAKLKVCNDLECVGLYIPKACLDFNESITIRARWGSNNLAGYDCAIGYVIVENYPFLHWEVLKEYPEQEVLHAAEEGMYYLFPPLVINGYQEDADYTSCADNTCDGNWSTSDYASHQITYIKQNGSIGAVWKVSDNCGNFSLPINSDCWKYSQTNITLSYLRGEGFEGNHYLCQASNGNCEDFTCSWDYPKSLLREEAYCGDLKEEGVQWIFPTVNCNNNYCEFGELQTCPQDCAYNNQCGDNICASSENKDNCPVDCYRTNLTRNIGSTYHSNTYVYSYLDNMSIKYPGSIRKELIGKTLQGKNMYMYVVGNGTNWSVMFDGRIHGPEDCGTETGTKFIEWVLTNDSIEAKYIKNGTTIYFTPIINQDSTRRQNMRRVYNLSNGTIINVTYGVDLNRNFPWGFGVSGKSNPTDSYEYRGLYGASEPETQAVVGVMTKYQPKAYANIHCGMQTFKGKDNGTVSQMIFYKMYDLSRKMNTSTAKVYDMFMLNYSTTFVDGMASFPNASSWLFEISNWENLPLTIDQYHQKWFKEALPVMIALSNPYTVNGTVSPPGNTTPVNNTIDNKGSPFAELFRPMNIVNTSVYFDKGFALYNSSKAVTKFSINNVNNKDRVIADATVIVKGYNQGYIIHCDNSLLMQIRQPPYNNIQVGIYNNTVWYPLITSPVLNLNQEYRLRFMYYEGNAYLFINGVLSGSVKINKKITMQPTMTCSVGNKRDNTRWFNGKIKDMQIVI